MSTARLTADVVLHVQMVPFTEQLQQSQDFFCGLQVLFASPTAGEARRHTSDDWVGGANHKGQARAVEDCNATLHWFQQPWSEAWGLRA